MCLAWLRFTSAGRRVFASNRAQDWVGTVAVAMFLVGSSTAGFTALSTGLYRLGVGSIKSGPLHGSSLVDAAYSYYLWHLADAIPLLKVPKTLNWQLSHPFTDSYHGALALIYTVLVIVPLIFAATQMIREWTADPEPKVSNAS
jgi:hypothetical protein